MKRLIIALATAIVIATPLIAAPVATANTLDPSFTIYEDQNAGGDHWRICTTSVCVHSFPNLINNANGLTPSCNGNPFQLNSWNDCITSIKLNLVSTNGTKYCLGVYDGANYTNTLIRISGNDYPEGYIFNLNSSQTDRATSIKWAAYTGVWANCPIP